MIDQQTSFKFIGLSGDFLGGNDFENSLGCANCIYVGGNGDWTGTSFSFTGFEYYFKVEGMASKVKFTPYALYASAAGVNLLPSPAVPEPATWAMMILGFGVVGAALRRRTPATRIGVPS